MQRDFVLEMAINAPSTDLQKVNVKVATCLTTCVSPPAASTPRSSTYKVGTALGARLHALSTMWMSRTRSSVVAKAEPAVMERLGVIFLETAPAMRMIGSAL